MDDGSTSNDDRAKTRDNDEERSLLPESPKENTRGRAKKKEEEEEQQQQESLGNSESGGDFSSSSSNDDIDEDALAAEFAAEFDSAINAAVTKRHFVNELLGENAKMKIIGERTSRSMILIRSVPVSVTCFMIAILPT